MTILLTNDDGFFAPGIAILADILSLKHNLWVVAPSTQQSAKSHGITLHEPVLFTKHGDQRYTCSGTPADCILYGMKGSLEIEPDLVISGINHGYNLGSDVVYSGTVGAAREAALRGVPGLALSSGDMSEEGFSRLAHFAVDNLETLRSYANREYLVNINYPRVVNKDPVARFTQLGSQIYNDAITAKKHRTSMGEIISYTICGEGEPQVLPESELTDIATTAQGDIAISLIATGFCSCSKVVAEDPIKVSRP